MQKTKKEINNSGMPVVALPNSVGILNSIIEDVYQIGHYSHNEACENWYCENVDSTGVSMFFGENKQGIKNIVKLTPQEEQSFQGLNAAFVRTSSNFGEGYWDEYEHLRDELTLLLQNVFNRIKPLQNNQKKLKKIVDA